MTTYMIRIVILGDSFSGKTSLFNMLLYGIAYESFCTTISPSFGKYLDNYILYDTPGQLRWLNFAKPYIEVADAAIIMYHESEESVNKWKKILYEMNGKEVPVLIVCTKTDATKKQDNVLYITLNEEGLHDKFQPFFHSLKHDPKISIGWVDYVYLLLPKVEDVIDQIPGCLQQ